MWGLWFVGLLAPRPRQHGMLHPTWCSFEQKGFAGLQGVQLDMGACAAPMPLRKRRAFNPKRCPRGHKICGNDF